LGLARADGTSDADVSYLEAWIRLFTADRLVITMTTSPIDLKYLTWITMAG
jgi:hypothetical protein